MALNAEDGGTRRCILVTNNENNICEQVTYERNRRVIQGYTTSKGVPVPGLTHNTLRYYRCEATVPRVPLLRHKRELVRRATDLLCLKENCYQPLSGTPADGGFRAFSHATGALVVVYDDLAVEAAAAFVAALPVPAAAPAGQPWCAVYVFAPGSYAYQDEFEAVAARVRLSALPEALYRAWQPLLPQASPEPTETLVMTVAPSALVAPRVPRPVGTTVAAPAAKAVSHGSLPLF
jgi:adenine-specific DNA-methyltransferase